MNTQRDRHRAREAALQMLYQSEIAGGEADAVVAAFWSIETDEAPVSRDVRDLAERLARGSMARLTEIDELIAAATEHWRPERMAIVDRSIMRLAVYELLAESETPPPVVIDEALELARRFSGDEAVPFVNGVLDAIKRSLQQTGRLAAGVDRA